MAKGPTVYDVAERAGVSIATVSFTYRQPQKVKESTRQLVLQAARELGYVPSASARGLAGGRTGALGLLSLDFRPGVPEIPAESFRSGASAAVAYEEELNGDQRLFPLYVDEVQRGVEMACWRRGYALMVAGANSDNSGSIVTDIAGRVDGLAVFSGTVKEADLLLVSRRLPVVILTGSTHDDDLSRVSVDNDTGIRELVGHLITAHGCRTLQFVGEIESAADRTERFAIFRAVLREAGLPVPRRPLATTGNYRQTVVGLLARQALPNAFVCVNDEAALDLMDALRALGVDVPGQVAVTGFDGIVAGRLISPPLTTVRQPMAALGAAAVDVLIDHIERPGEPSEFRQLPVRPVIRESCGCLP